MAFVTYNATAETGTIHRVVMPYETQAAANTAAAGDTDLTARTGSVDDNVEPGWFIDTSDGSVSKTRTVTSVETRRGQVIRWLQTEFDTANLSLWSASDDATAISDGRWGGLRPRTANTIAWAEMIDRAAHVDSNLTDDAKWALIEAEMNLGVQNWYAVHDESSWTAARGALLTVWYATQANGAAATATPTISMTLSGDQVNHKFNDYLKS